MVNFKLIFKSNLKKFKNLSCIFYRYFEKDDAGIKLSCGLTLFSIVQNNAELMTKFSKRYTPFTFFAMHHQTESQMKIKQRQLEYEQQHMFRTDYETRSHMPQIPNNVSQAPSIWVELWEEITSGTEYAIKANLSEILRFVKMGLDHKSWDMRVQSALAICTICTKLQSNIELEFLNELLQMFLGALNTRTWNGKVRICRYKNIITGFVKRFLNLKTINFLRTRFL